ncbi:hypothetical protein [Rhodanobacter sp. C03]|uniref:hypothetical protein n=1 Tax=Rhodanobacter sp. C03 TaxID=1945858 RepID=UPI0009859C27|nr:hypothetical protein [Rhodanobacter sp. C03]OOG55636.1 hypothetical protein B0E48_13495 [Rhodanobacter sp. C03]
MSNNITGQNLRLHWTDFIGHVPQNRPANQVAFTSASYSINFGIAQAYASIGMRVPNAQNDLGFVVSNLQIKVTLNRHLMWSVTSAQTPELLAHEQGHYDIVALTMSDLFNDLLSPPTVMATENDVRDFARALQTEAARRIDAMESSAAGDGLYDQQTNHSLNQPLQAHWDSAFALARPPTGLRFDLALGTQNITP